MVGRVLVTGGVRSGKSAHAEQMLADRADVTYVAAGPSYDDEDWAARIARHRARRPSSWSTLETGDLVSALTTTGPVLVDCLGTWLTGLLDRESMWEAPVDVVDNVVTRHTEDVVTALVARPGDAPTVLVTNEVGFGVVPDHRSGRLFRDLLGTLNQRVGVVCDDVHLVVSGRVLRLN